MTPLTRKMRIAVFTGWIAAVALLGLAVPLKEKLSKPTNVILISIDALRADHLGCYGYPKPTSPCIDAFASRNVTFEHACSPQPWTLTSHLSMRTSLYPDTHDVHEGVTLSHKWQTLAEILKKHGYATGAFVTNSHWLNGTYGHSRGFDHYWCRDERGELANAALADFVIKNRAKPMYLFIHYYDVHAGGGGPDYHLPYYAPDEIRKLFMPNRPHVFRGGDGVYWSTSYLLHAEEKGIRLNDEEVEELRALYDAAVRLADNNLCNLFKMLKKEDVFDNSIIIITADHGEELQDHGHFLHFQLYEEVFHVPLIIRIPRKLAQTEPLIKEPQKISGLAGLIDIFPTVLDCLGIPYPENQVQGHSLLPLMRGGKNARRYAFASEFDLIAKQNRMAVRDASWKLICTGNKNPRCELYYLPDDPLERVNLADKHPEKVSELRETIDLWKKANRHMREQSESQENYHGLSDEDRQKLRSLGYITK